MKNKEWKQIKLMIQNAGEVSLGMEMLEWVDAEVPMTKDNIIKKWAEYEVIDDHVSERAFKFISDSCLLMEHDNIFYSFSSKKHKKMYKEALKKKDAKF